MIVHNSAGYKKEKYLNLIDIVIPVELKLYFILKLCSQSQNCSIKCHMIKLRDRAFEAYCMKVLWWRLSPYGTQWNNVNNNGWWAYTYNQWFGYLFEVLEVQLAFVSAKIIVLLPMFSSCCTPIKYHISSRNALGLP